jgi:site-specific DNA-methyltransferase (adenine-specific)
VIEDVTLICGDCLAEMPGLAADSVDAIVTDPPYGLMFMGKDWDHGVPGVLFWEAALRVAKPGAHLLAFGGTRTFHRLAVAIEDAGWEIRDTIMWVYGSGFPKSLDVSKAIDRAAGAEREVVGDNPNGRPNMRGKQTAVYSSRTDAPLTAPATPDAIRWQGWGTALKPAWEPIIVARKPVQGTVAANVLAWGTGAINVAGCMVDYGNGGKPSDNRWGGFPDGGYTQPKGYDNAEWLKLHPGGHREFSEHPAGRWPANVIHDGSDEVVGLMPVTTSNSGNLTHSNRNNPNGIYGVYGAGPTNGISDTGSAARFFYCAKASKADRDEGCEGLAEHSPGERTDRKDGSDGLKSPRAGAGRPASSRNHHPTVKPTDLMRYLVRLVTPPGGVVLDPFMGSGSTGKAAVLAGFRFVGIEREPGYVEIARARIAAAQPGLL